MTRIALFGATGMAGQGVLREALLDPSIASIIAIGRRPSGKDDPKLRDLVVKDPGELKENKEMANVDACLYCVGVASSGVTEAEYTAITKTMALSAADSLLTQNPKMRFLFISGDGTDPKSRQMWARVKGETELALLARSPEAVMFRPGLIEPVHGIKGNQSLMYRFIYASRLPTLLRPLGLPVVTTEALGRAMLRVAKQGSPKSILDNADINRLGAAGP